MLIHYVSLLIRGKHAPKSWEYTPGTVELLHLSCAFWRITDHRIQCKALITFKVHSSAIYLLYQVSFVGERGRPPYIFGCQGSLMEGWRKWASEKGGGGYSLAAKQEVAQHLFLGIQRGTEWPAVCCRVCLNAQSATCRQTMWRSSDCFPKSLTSESNCVALLIVSISFKIEATLLISSGAETNVKLNHCQRLSIRATFQKYSKAFS